MESYAGIDLHASNNYTAVIDDHDKRLYGKNQPNRLDVVLSALDPFKTELKGVVVESTFNWYWLVDGLMENGYKVHLANPSAIKQYEGLKHTDDKWDAFWLAHMLRLNILPEGYIYPKEERPVRDLLRRRLLFVKHRTSHILSLQSMITRNLGVRMACRGIKKLMEEDAESMFDSPYLVLAAKNNIATIQFLKKRIKVIEREIRPLIKIREEFKNLLTIPGIGDILGFTIMLEVGQLSRFPKVGDYSSYCRCVKSERLSNGKKKDKNNKKNGNKYLSWAYIEAANFIRRYCPKAQSFYQRKMAKAGGIVATKALSNKVARASYYVMRDQVPFDEDKLFA
jgi:transposase